MERERASGWRTIESEIVIETPHLRLRKDAVELPSGSVIGPYFVRESRGFAVVFALTPDERVVLVRQYKYGADAIVLELPAGAIDPDETPEDCALRELAEETGYVPEEPLEHVGSFIYDPTSSTARYHLYVARSVRLAGAQHLDETEVIDVRLATFAELRRFVRDGTIDVGTHIACVYYVLDLLGLL